MLLLPSLISVMAPSGSHASVTLAWEPEGAITALIANLDRDRFEQLFADVLVVHAVEDLIEKAFHHHPDGGVAGDAPAHQVEEIFFINLTDGRAVGGSHVVGFDLQAGNRVGPSRAFQEHVFI